MQGIQSFIFRYLIYCVCCLGAAFFHPIQAQSAAKDSIFYAINSPDAVFELDYVLHEISALSTTPDSNLLCAVQDESGVLYFIKKSDGAIVKKVPFRFSGDFEGVEFVDSVAFAVKSNGDIFRIQHWDTEKPLIDSFSTILKKEDDIEGLGYLPEKRALLLAAKGNPTENHQRTVYAFSVDSLTLDKKPFLEINPNDVECALGKKQEDDNDCFSPSAIAVHPITGEYYLLSAARKRLVILNKEGKLVYAEKIDKKIMPQPEGIAFGPDGTLYISSEGKKGNKGLLLTFKPRRL